VRSFSIENDVIEEVITVGEVIGIRIGIGIG